MGRREDQSGTAGPPTRLQEALQRRSGAQNIAVFTLDVDGRVATWTPDAQRVYGYTADEVMGRHVSMFYSPDTPADYPDEELLARAAETGVHVDELWRVRRDGTRFWAYVVVAAQRSAEGEVRGFIKVVRDDTAVRLRQERTEQRFADLVELTPVGVALLDEHDRIRDSNSALSRLTGYSRVELLGRQVTGLLRAEERELGLGSSPAAGNGPAPAIERTLLSRDGAAVTCEISRVTSVQDDGRAFQLIVFQDVTARIHEAELLQHQASHDALTGLPNRRGIEPLLQQRTDNTAVLLCDIDNFKRINDAFGHAAGDDLMVQLAGNLSRAHLPQCTIARLSGDEFLIVCADAPAAGGLQALADEASRALHLTTSVRGQLVRVTAAIGAAMAPADARSGDDLLRYAFAAMYDAKRRGAQKVVLAADNPSAQVVREQVQLETHLEDALRTGGLELHYQPIVDARRRPIAAEALVRWRHPEFGMLSPGTFLTVAEQAGLMEELDRWVLRTALREAAHWPDTGPAPVPVGVNLSNHSAGNPEFLLQVRDELAAAGLAANRLTLEITETSLVDLSGETVQAVEELIGLGVAFAVDDFGSGYSSLARLKTLPPATIKLDRQFVGGIEHHEFDRAIVRSSVDMAHATGRMCVVEGVETEVQFHMLDVLGVDAFQGFLFSRPVPGDQLHAVLAERSPMPFSS